MTHNLKYIDKYAQDWKETKQPWTRWQQRRDCNYNWEDCLTHPDFHLIGGYQFKRKEFIVEYITVNGIQVENGASNFVEGQYIYYPNVSNFDTYISCLTYSKGSPFGERIIKHRLGYHTEQGARIRAKAMLGLSE